MSRIAAVVFLMLAACNSTATPRAAQSPATSTEEARAIGEASTRRPRPARELATDDAHEKTAKNDPSSAAKQPFPRDDAKVALRAAEGGLRSCRLGNDAWEVEVLVKFDPSSGSVTSAEVTPMRGSRDTELFKTFESCMKTRLTEVSVTPFAGQAVTMTVPMKL